MLISQRNFLKINYSLHNVTYILLPNSMHPIQFQAQVQVPSSNTIYKSPSSKFKFQSQAPSSTQSTSSEFNTIYTFNSEFKSAISFYVLFINSSFSLLLQVQSTSSFHANANSYTISGWCNSPSTFSIHIVLLLFLF